MIKKVISITLVASITFASLTAHAIMETPDANIQTNYVKGSRESTLNESDLIQIDTNEIRAKNLLNTTSLLDNEVFNEYNDAEGNGELQRDISGETEIPDNVTEIEEYVCLNEEDEEDITEIEDVIIDGGITPIESTSPHSSRSI